MKVFKISVRKVNWDEYDSCVVIAEDEDAVRAMLRENDEKNVWESGKDLFLDGEETGVFFYNHQGEITIEEVDLTKPALICSSFNAG